MMTREVVYCVDSSALIEIRERYPSAIFPGLWEGLTELVRAGRFIAPREVLKEVEKDTGLNAWLKRNRKRMFVAPTQAQVNKTIEILQRFSDLIDPAKTTPDADPFVIALAIVSSQEAQRQLFGREHVVLTFEKLSSGSARPRIPNVCAHYGVGCLHAPSALTDFFAKEGWRFIRPAN